MNTHDSGEHNANSLRAAFWAIFAIAAALRLYALGRYAFWYDEGASIYLARYVDLHGSLFRAQFTTEPPMMALLSWGWQGVVGLLPLAPISYAHDAAIRLLPAAFSLAALPCVFYGMRALFRDSWLALVAMSVLAAAPLQVYYAQEFRIYAFYILLALVATGAMIRAVEDNDRRCWLLMVAMLTLLMYSHFFSMFLIFSLNVAFVLAMPWHGRRLPQWFGWNLLLMVLIAPALYLAFRMQAQVNTLEYTWYPNPTWKTPLITAKTFFAAYTPRPWVYWPLFLLGSCGGIAGLYLLRKRPLAAVTAATLAVVPVIFCAVLWGRASFSFYEHRLFIFSGTILLLLCAVALARLPRWGLALAAACLAPFIVPSLADVYGHRLHPVEMHRLAMWDKIDYRSAARYIDRHWEAGDRVAHASHFTVYSMAYYLDRPQVRLGLNPEDISIFIRNMGNPALLRNHGLMPVMLDQATEGVERLWLLRSQGITFEWQPFTDELLRVLGQNWTLAETRHYDGLVLYCFTRDGSGNELETP